MNELIKAAEATVAVLKELNKDLRIRGYGTHIAERDLEKALAELEKAPTQQAEPYGYVLGSKFMPNSFGTVPLASVEVYTHPSNVKRLSGDEVKELFRLRSGEREGVFGVVEFANAIMDGCDMPPEVK